MPTISFFWFRRDLRLEDNSGLYHALKSGKKIQCIFIFDKNILDELPRDDARVSFIHDSLLQLDCEVQKHGSSLLVKHGNPYEIWASLANQYKIIDVFTNHDFEPYAKDRDNKISLLLQEKNIGFKTYKDHVIFEGNEVLKDDGKPYTVFTPYKKKWLAKLESKKSKGQYFYLKPYPTSKYFTNFHPTHPLPIPSLSDLGFTKSSLPIPTNVVAQKIIKDYDKQRDFPAINGTSKLGIHFRFGTISIREKANKALALNQTYLSELIWRDFYSMIIYNFPHVVGNAFRPEYDKIEWRYDENDLQKWQEGVTGYPIVDAGMRELNNTGHMHNRVRMIVASFLTKHLLIDWRMGEAYFAEKLLDFDLASNNGGWQWAAGCGTDAAPYFRIFSPAAQQEKFDKDQHYIKKWIPEFGTNKYTQPIVDHKFARERCLVAYKKALKGE